VQDLQQNLIIKIVLIDLNYNTHRSDNEEGRVEKKEKGVVLSQSALLYLLTHTAQQLDEIGEKEKSNNTLFTTSSTSSSTSISTSFSPSSSSSQTQSKKSNFSLFYYIEKLQEEKVFEFVSILMTRFSFVLSGSKRGRGRGSSSSAGRKKVGLIHTISAVFWCCFSVVLVNMRGVIA
jgi:hypothetical protein